MFANFDIFENGRVCSQTHMYVIRIPLNLNLYVCMSVYIYVCMCVCIHVCSYVCVFVCMYITCVYMYVYNHIHDYMVYAARTCKG